MVEKVIILGSGPAGYTAAIYAARAALAPTLIEGREPGGQLTITTEVENFPGFPKGIQGPDLMLAMREQAERFGTKIISSEVTEVNLTRRPFTLISEGKKYLAESLIISTGARARWLGLENETALRGKGVSACAICDGFFFKGQDVVVVGGGDTAIEEATYLTNFTKSVTIIHRRDELRATQAMQARAKANPKISFIWNSVVVDIKDVKKGKVTSVVLKDVKNGKMSEKVCDGVFVAIGHEPNTALFKGQLKLDENSYIVVTPGTTKTSVDGVFAAGDVCDPVYKQAVSAAGMGCMAALDAQKFLHSV